MSTANNNFGEILDRASLNLFNASTNVHSISLKRDNVLAKKTEILLNTCNQDIQRLSLLAETQNHKLSLRKLQSDSKAVLARFQLALKNAPTIVAEVVPQENSDQVESHPLLQLTQPSVTEHEISFNEALIHERDQEIHQITTSIGQVHEIFRDLGALVHEQGMYLDNIENNVENTAVNLEAAEGELRRARDYQMRARRRMMFCWLIIFVVVFVILLSVII